MSEVTSDILVTRKLKLNLKLGNLTVKVIVRHIYVCLHFCLCPIFTQGHDFFRPGIALSFGTTAKGYISETQCILLRVLYHGTVLDRVSGELCVSGFLRDLETVTFFLCVSASYLLNGNDCPRVPALGIK